MSKELVARLRSADEQVDEIALFDEAADAIEALEQRVAELEAELHELDGCREQSVIRGNEVIRLGREVVELRRLLGEPS